MFNKRFVVASLHEHYPLFLAIGSKPPFDEIKVDAVTLHFGFSASDAIKINTEVEAEVWVGALIYMRPEFAPLSIVPVYEPIIQGERVETNFPPAEPNPLL